MYTVMASSIRLTVMFMCLILSNVVLEAETKAFFVFGDSLVDSGNNNYLVTLARADSPPYGIDYPSQRATGRFSNGYNIPDLISQAIGEEATMPYLSPNLTGEKLLVGANFASAGVGILNDTGSQFGHLIKIKLQMQYFEQYQQRVSDIIGPKETKRLVNQALTFMTLGGNDFVNNYYLVPFSLRSRQFSLPDYVVYVISEYRKILKQLYQLGLRRIMVSGTGPLGCAPAELAQHSPDGNCAPELQRAANLFNPQIQALADSLNSKIGSNVFIGVNTRETNFDFISNPERYGFVTSKVACCGQGPYNGIGICTKVSNLCADRNAYVFWDAFHLTERANRLVVQQILTGSTDFMSPMNLSTIMALDASNNM
ncbi:GDSL esterase/lipase LTL1-like [Rutidosis leptorrhynchoides]|uniref:GDSL esterase/lipase LTL1-like n=1 Tax=Rutidosis leptorrhynchoides TaxID=125765 RepID=UPI003A99ED2C